MKSHTPNAYSQASQAKAYSDVAAKTSDSKANDESRSSGQLPPSSESAPKKVALRKKPHSTVSMLNVNLKTAMEELHTYV